MMPLIGVGFDRADISDTENYLYTSGLANCIAVGGFRGNRMVLAHYNTLFCFEPSNGGMVVLVEKLFELKKWLEKLLGVGALEYRISLGTIWSGLAYGQGGKSQDNQWDMRHRLIVALRMVFDHEPQECGGSAILRGDKILGSFLNPQVTQLVTDGEWERSGTKIPY